MEFSAKPNKAKAKKIIYIIIAAIAIAVFFALAVGAYNTRENLSRDDEIDVVLSAIEDTPEAIITPTIEPSPTPRLAFIPDPDGLLPLPDVKTIEIQEDILEGEIIEDELNISWEIVEDADYYVFCVINKKSKVYHKEILWSDIGEWILTDVRDGSTVYLFCYQDMGEDSAEDDELIATFSMPVVIDAPEETKSPEATPEASADPDEDILNKYYIIVDKSDFTFSAFTYDDNGNYTILVKSFPTAIGRSSRMTPNGTFEISSKGAWKSWGTGSYSPYYTRFTSGLYFHGALYDLKTHNSMYSKYYNEIGSASSSGCLRTTWEAAKWVYYNCPAGTKVKIVDSSNKVSKAYRPDIDPAYPKWDPTDPDKPSLDPPVIVVNDRLELGEGASASLEGLLSATDEVVDNDTLVYEVITPPTNGSLTKNTFTQLEIDSGSIEYTHDDSETTSDIFTFRVSNLSKQTTLKTFRITINPVDDTPPTIEINEWIEINQGASQSLKSFLLASDDEVASGDLVYTVTSMPDNGSVPATFTQAELLAGTISYMHDGSETTTDSFIFSVSDGTNVLAGQMFSISIDILTS